MQHRMAPVIGLASETHFIWIQFRLNELVPVNGADGSEANGRVCGASRPAAAAVPLYASLARVSWLAD